MVYKAPHNLITTHSLNSTFQTPPPLNYQDTMCHRSYRLSTCHFPYVSNALLCSLHLSNFCLMSPSQTYPDPFPQSKWVPSVTSLQLFTYCKLYVVCFFVYPLGYNIHKSRDSVLITTVHPTPVKYRKHSNI